jgi:hypothetical protein
LCLYPVVGAALADNRADNVCAAQAASAEVPTLFPAAAPFLPVLEAELLACFLSAMAPVFEQAATELEPEVLLIKG